MDLITVDFETYYSNEFSLSKMTTEEYINDDHFEVIGVAVKVNNDKTRWFTGSMEATQGWLNQFDWGNSAVLAHNTTFDGAILAWRFGLHPKVMFDTLSMARAVHGIQVGGSLAKLAEHYELGAKGTEVVMAMGKRRADFTLAEMQAYAGYCKNDVDLTYALFQKLMALPYPKAELKLIDLTLRMYTQPVFEFDLPALESHLSDVQAKKEALLRMVDADRETLMSNDKFAQALRDLGVDPPTKISARTGKESWAFAKTDEAFKALAEHDDPRVQALVSARLGTKSTLEETRTERFIAMAKRIGVLPVPLKYYGAHTGRWAGMDKVNLQNLPSRGPAAGKIKEAIVAPKGYVVINCDSSQIEARMVAWLAGQADLTQAFEDKEDVYKIMASAIYNKPVDAIDKHERAVGKSTILGAGYGMGPIRFRDSLVSQGINLDPSEAQHIINTYRNTYRHIPFLWRRAQQALEAIVNGQHIQLGPDGVMEFSAKDKGFRMPSGLWQKYPTLERETDAEGKVQFGYTSRYGFVRMHGPKLVENLSQGLARCVIGEQMLRIAKRYRPVLTVHDSVVVIAPEAELDEAARYLAHCMSWRPDWARTLPLACEVEVGRSYGDLEEYEL